MDHPLSKLMKERLTSGLERQSMTTCSRWAQGCVVTGKPYPGPFSFEHHPWQREMHDSNASVNVGMKSAQMGYSTSAINRTFFKMDIERVNCLYLLPTKVPDAVDFSVTKFDAALESSPHLARLFSSVKNAGVKRAGATTLWIRGMNSRSGLKGIDPAFIVFDELDEMPEEKIPLAEHRMDGQTSKQMWKISTPTVPDFGIDKAMQESSNEHYFFNCPNCHQRTELLWDADPEQSCLVVCGNAIDDPDIKRTYVRCKECKKPLESHFVDGCDVAKTAWLNAGKPGWHSTQTNPNMDCRGFYINQLYSTTISPVELAKAVFKAQYDPHIEQELFNSMLGLAHIVDGARVTDEMINNAIMKGGGYSQRTLLPPGGTITMGVDPGKWLHYVICQWFFPRFANDLNIMADCRVLMEGKAKDFGEIEQLMQLFQPQMTVIDSEPEARETFDLCTKHWGRVKMCKYTRGHTDRMLKVSNATDSHYITADRTAWLDMSMGRFRSGRIQLPADVSPEYKEHLKGLIKQYKTDKTGNPVAEYKKVGADHLAHAQNYAEIALPLAASLISNKDIAQFM